MIGRLILACVAAAALTIGPAVVEGIYNGRWGKATVEVALAILQSARDGREVVLEHQVAVDGSSG